MHTTRAQRVQRSEARKRVILSRLQLLGMSRRDLYRALNLSRDSLHRRFTGETDWRADELVTVAQVLDIPTSDLTDVELAVAS